MFATIKRWKLAVIHWLGGTDLFLLLGLLILVGGVLLFLVLADLVEGGRTQSLDVRIMEWVCGLDKEGWISPQMAEELGRDMTALGGVAVITLVTLGVVGYLLICRKYHAAVLVVVATVGGLALSSTLKYVIDRPRPKVCEHRSLAVTSSFPSGHSTMAAVVYFTLAALLARSVRRRGIKRYLLSVAALLTLLVGFSRVYMGVHYPTDVLAGWSVGLAWAVVCWLLARWLQEHGAVEKPS